MKLPEHLSEHLIRYQNLLRYRDYIIDLFAYVGNRPELVVYPSELPDASHMKITIRFEQLPNDAKFQVPVPVDQLPTYKKSDPVQNWKSTNGCELIGVDPDPWELVWTYRNWNLMTDDQKQSSDQKCMELFGVTNHDHFYSQLNHFLDSGDRSKLGSIIAITDANYKNTCVGAVVDIDMKEGTLTYQYLGNNDSRLINEIDTFDLKPGDISCCKEPITTTAGRFLLNVLLVDIPFRGAFPYINKAGFDLKALEKDISRKLLAKEIEISQYKTYVNNLFFIGHFTELCVPGLSKASLTTDPNIKKLKQELFKEYEGRLTDPLVITKIEDQLIAADKAYLKNDKSMRFYTPLGGKPFNIARKKMYLTVGGIESFSKDSNKYTFIKNSLEEGWDVTQFPAYSNEIRKGSYNRGHETQLGGAQTKYIVRVFQDLSLVEDDCHATRGLQIDFSVHDIKEFIGRFIRDKGKWVEITEENMSKYSNGQYVMRSPMYCRSESGLCRVCAGSRFSKLDVGHISMYIVDISSTFTTMALKLMHGSKVEMMDLGDLNNYLI